MDTFCFSLNKLFKKDDDDFKLKYCGFNIKIEDSQRRKVLLRKQNFFKEL